MTEYCPQCGAELLYTDQMIDEWQNYEGKRIGHFITYTTCPGCDYHEAIDEYQVDDEGNEQ